MDRGEETATKAPGRKAQKVAAASVGLLQRCLLMLIISAFLVMFLTAQETPLAFDVVSVKRTPAGTRGGGFDTPPGQFIARNYAVRSLIVLAYPGIAGYQVVDLPAWIEDERYDIVAKTPPGTLTPQQRRAMLQGLLADRFKLKTHRETRELPIYALVHARSDKKLGPSLLPTTLDCAAVRAKRDAAGTAPTTPEQLMECGFLTANLPGGARRMRAKGVSLAELAGMIRTSVDRPVFDQTGLTAGFDLDLTFVPQVGGPSPGDQVDAAFIFTAVQEQLGLKLESTKAAVEVLVIDSIERPTEN